MRGVILGLRTQREICSISDFYANYLPNGRNEISALIRIYGWQIYKTWNRHGDGTSHLHYALIAEGRPIDAPKQLTLITR